jgi:hypothetical protein
LCAPTSSATEAISDEFISRFWDTADRATSADVRALFARILALECTKPGSFSASTLNLLSVLHPEVARKFERLCCMSFGFSDFDFVVLSMPHSDAPSKRHNSLGGSTGRNGEQLLEFDIGPQDLLEMRTVGLTRSMPREEYPNLAAFFQLSSVDFSGQRLAMRVREGAPKEPGFSIEDATNAISLTRSGSELRSILALRPFVPYLKKLVEVMNNAGVTLS